MDGYLYIALNKDGQYVDMRLSKSEPSEHEISATQLGLLIIVDIGSAIIFDAKGERKLRIMRTPDEDVAEAVAEHFKEKDDLGFGTPSPNLMKEIAESVADGTCPVCEEELDVLDGITTYCEKCGFTGSLA